MSDYRDEHEALLARNAALEDALAAQEAEIARLRAGPAVMRARRAALGMSPNVSASGAVAEDALAPDLTRSAWIGCAVLGLVYAVDIAAGLVLRAAGDAGADASIVWTALVGTATVALVVVILCGRPLRRLPGVGADFMVGRVYMAWLFGLFFPNHPLIEGLIRIGSTRAGGYRTGGGDTAERYQPVIVMSRGEGRPLGVALLMMALLWPLAVLSLVSPWIHRG